MKGKVRLENICQLIKQQSSNIFCVTATIVVFGLLNQNETIDGFAAFTNSEHFSIISVSSLFGGFLFTGLAELVGVSRNTVSSIETGQFNPTAKLALVLCIALDKKFEELFYFD